MFFDYIEVKTKTDKIRQQGILVLDKDDEKISVEDIMQKALVLHATSLGGDGETLYWVTSKRGSAIPYDERTLRQAIFHLRRNVAA